MTAIDQIAVDLAVSGELPARHHVDRVAAVRVLWNRGWPDGQIAGRLQISERTVLRIRQKHDMDPNTTRGRNVPEPKRRTNA